MEAEFCAGNFGLDTHRKGVAHMTIGSSRACYDVQNSFSEDPIPNSLLTGAYVTEGLNALLHLCQGITRA